ncbi:proteoglycan 3-like [Bos indicus x Bos taurus]|uniref:Proteoglycan 3-like n=1 Tax=Bos indicus x Bos taurus TaxID=30522 RepID=A0A4W2EDM4_BOBOX|nr:proteoglycan 3-like [Bos indicus x Bos taurus]XP_027418110.1 proteoglycan 3-like [Bos indicus x Bos taurus]XP_027418111.1 proteoglycan 3-like [Bos indicus x Bos taurus]
MKGCLVLLLLLLGTVSALYLEKDVPHLGDLETQADLSQDSEGSGGQEGELALSGEVLESGREEAEDTHDDEGASDPDDLDEDVQCPKEEETVQLLGSPECKTCRYRLVGTPRRFRKAQRVCRKCYRGNLASIHNFNVNLIIHRLSTTTNYGQVWIGGFIRGRLRCRRFFWTDGSYWNFAFWAAGQPRFGRGRCVALCTRGGHWRRASCKRRLPFVCSY